MSVQQHVESLSEKHRKLDELISQEMAHPGSDGLKLKELKRCKLKLKQEIARFSH
jgi:hypothetical protein